MIDTSDTTVCGDNATVEKVKSAKTNNDTKSVNKDSSLNDSSAEDSATSEQHFAGQLGQAAPSTTTAASSNSRQQLDKNSWCHRQN